MAGLKTAKFLGELAKDVTPDETEVFETYGVKEGMEKMPNLPRVAYVQMLQSQGLMHDTYVYGVDAKRTLSTIMNPTEGMDGAIVSGNCVSACDKNTTYHHLNNPVVKDLFAQHGKTLNFVGMILTNENVYLADKQRSSDWTAKLCRVAGPGWRCGFSGRLRQPGYRPDHELQEDRRAGREDRYHHRRICRPRRQVPVPG